MKDCSICNYCIVHAVNPIQRSLVSICQPRERASVLYFMAMWRNTRRLFLGGTLILYCSVGVSFLLYLTISNAIIVLLFMGF